MYICKILNIDIYIYLCTRYFRHTSWHPSQCSQAWNLQSKPAERGRLHPIMLTVNNLPKPPSGMPQNRSTPTWHRLCKCRSWAWHHVGVRLQLNVNNITPPTPTPTPTPCPACASWRNMNTATPHHPMSTVAFMACASPACASWRNMNTAPPHTTPWVA